MTGPMNVNLDALRKLSSQITTQETQKEGAIPFQDVLKGFMNEVNDLQLNMDKKIDMFASGQVKDVHEVMVAVEEADIAFQLMMEIRNKLIKAYEEVMKMQV